MKFGVTKSKQSTPSIFLVWHWDRGSGGMVAAVGRMAVMVVTYRKFSVRMTNVCWHYLSFVVVGVVAGTIEGRGLLV